MPPPDLARLWGRTLTSLGLAPLPPGQRPPPGAAMARLMFAFVWLILGVIETAAFLRGGTWPVLVLAGLLFALAGLNLGRARRLLEAQRRSDDDPGEPD